MPGLIDLMKSTKVERVSNADRAGYALRASPNARRRKDQTYTISLQQGCPINDFPQSVEGAHYPPFSDGGPITRGWAKSEYRCDRPSMLSVLMDLLTWRQPTKMIVATKK